VTAKRLTDPRGQILAAIRYSMRTRGYPPTMREIAAAVGFSSTATVSHHLRAMAADGLIRRDPDKPRAIVIADIQPTEERPMRNNDPIQAEFHRGRTALRDASMAYGTFVAGGSKGRTPGQAGADALARTDAAITYLQTARASLAAALNSEAAPGATGAAPDPTKEIQP
jgi:hypothetical protein